MSVHDLPLSAEQRFNKLLGRTAAGVSSVLLVAGLVNVSACSRCSGRSGTAVESKKSAIRAQSDVWVVDDSVRVARAPGSWARVRERAGHVWRFSESVDLVALPGETVAVQVVLVAGKGGLSDGHVRLAELKSPDGKHILKDRPGKGLSFSDIQRFVVYDIPMPRRSGGKDPSESLGWEPGARPTDPSIGESIPDALLPVSYAGRWSQYPLEAKPGEARVVWLDITLPDDASSGKFQGTISVDYVEPGDAQRRIQREVPIAIDVGHRKLPYRAAKTMVYFEPEDEVVERTGSKKAAIHAFQLLHRHHLSPIFQVRSAEDVLRHAGAMSGAYYTPNNGYVGPGEGVGTDVVAIGAYGTMKEPTEQSLAQVESILEALEMMAIGDEPGKRDIFLYAVDEDCDSPRGPDWKKALASSKRPRLSHLRVGHTCSEPPAEQPVDLPIVFAQKYDPSKVRQAVARGKHVWVYNGVLPHTGAFLTDAWTLSLRANGWIQARFDIERWFYWEVVFWNDNNKGGLGPHDPFATTETFHNQHGDHCNGDGLLLYPGSQVKGMGRSLGLPGVVSSIRIKQWRRGIEDAGYYRLAAEYDRGFVSGLADSLLGSTLQRATRHRPKWAGNGRGFFQARRKLFRVIESHAGSKRGK